MDLLQFKKVNCKNCYKCVRYCPVKSIEVSSHQAKIIDTDCILCGNCTIVCPQNAKEDVSDLPQVINALQEGKEILASVAPSYAAYFEQKSFETMHQALKELGFAGAYETAEGAYVVKSEYERLMEEEKHPVLISSCCPTVVTYIEKYCPEAIHYVAPVASPMNAHAKLLKQRNPEAKVVFIGPCISKKGERREEVSQTDYVLTFEELAEWLEKNQVYIEASKGEESKLSRFFPVNGGIIKTLKQKEGFSYLSIDGIDQCMEALKEIAGGKLNGCFVEMSACKGSCIGGPSFRKLQTQNGESKSRQYSGLAAYQAIEGLAFGSYDADYNLEDNINIAESRISKQIKHIKPTETQLLGILKKMGKNTKQEELNCGMCGYATCREKAEAVFLNRAEITMCLPFMKERAESLSDKIINVTPNAILTVDLDLKVQQMNDTAAKLFGILTSDVIGGPVSRLLDEFDFVNMIINSVPNVTKYAFLTEYNLYVEQYFLFDKAAGIVICIMKDITKEKLKKNKIRKARLQAASMADDIVAKQLRIVHEIASLLGETAAETKLAVNDLKETIMMDKEED